MRFARPPILGVLLALSGCDRRGAAEAPATRMPHTGPEPDPVVLRRLSPPPPRPPATRPGSGPGIVLVPEEPEHIPAPPPDYGRLKPSDGVPAASALSVHGLAGFEVVTVYDKPDVEARSLGYLRVGTRMKVSKARAGKGCRGSWHQLAQGGYACVGRGLVVDAKRPPVLHTPATAPDLEAELPYGYAFVKRWNSPMYWRPPTARERDAAASRRDQREAERQRAAEPDADDAPTASSLEPPASGGARAEAVDDPVAEAALELSGLPAASVALETPELPPAALAESADEVVEPAPEPPPEPEVKLPLNPQTPWLERGFFIAIGDKIDADGIEYWQTARGGFVEGDAAYAYAAKGFRGQVLPEGAAFPMGFVMTLKGAKRFELGDDGQLRAVGTIGNKTFVDIEHVVEHSGTDYVLLTDGSLVRKAVVRFAEPQPLPEGLEPYDRWIDVNLVKQMLVAYEGVHPVFVTLVSTGKQGSEDESFETPTGRWRIRSKHVSTTMDGASATDGNYSIQDVPWTMFFHESIALHGAFWHDGFGRVRSHGCVNLGPADAKWLFEWTTPHLPAGWHGVHAHPGTPGTTVVVRG